MITKSKFCCWRWFFADFAACEDNADLLLCESKKKIEENSSGGENKEILEDGMFYRYKIVLKILFWIKEHPIYINSIGFKHFYKLQYKINQENWRNKKLPK